MTFGPLRLGPRRGAAIGLAVLMVTGVGARVPALAAAQIGGVVRVDQVGYRTFEAKRAYLLAEGVASGARFSVIDAAGHAVFRGRVGASRGSWNTTFTAVHELDFSSLRRQACSTSR